jgi:L-rhamnose mutarotase
VIQEAFVMWLKPGGAEEYIRLHGDVPRQVLIDEEAAGVTREFIWRRGNMLFVFSELRDARTWERARSSEAARQWAVTLEPYLEMTESGEPKTEALELVYSHDTGPV